MWLIDRLAEVRIREAMEGGVFDALPGSGRPLELDEQPLVPEEIRVARRILRNDGFVPPEIGLRAEIRDVEDLLRTAAAEADRARLGHRLNMLLIRLSAAGRGRYRLLLECNCLERAARRLDAPGPST